MILAVDGGNSKTDIALVADDGSLLAHVRGPLSSPHHLGLDGCLSVLQSLVNETGLNGRRAELAQLLLAGVDFPDEEDALRAAVEERGWAARTLVGNDTFAVLRAGSDRGWGIAITCGAGMNCVGVGPDGRHVRFPALGHITGDWGGGFDVGLAALGAAVRSEDGRGPKTMLEHAVPAHFARSSPVELARDFHERRIPQSRLVELAPLVMSASADDPAAAAIVDKLVEEIVALVRAAAARLDLDEAEVLLGGGLMRGARDEVIEQIAAALGDRLVLRRPNAPPIVGAALLALDAVGATDEARLRAREQLTAAVDGEET